MRKYRIQKVTPLSGSPWYRIQHTRFGIIWSYYKTWIAYDTYAVWTTYELWEAKEQLEALQKDAAHNKIVSKEIIRESISSR